MKVLRLIYLLCLALLAAACSDSEQFRVNGSIKGKPTMNLRVEYFADGAYRSAITASREGEFEFFGRSSQPAILEITDYDHRPLARLVVRNGENYELVIDPADRLATTMSGGDVNSRWSSLLRDNKDAIAADANAFVASYVGSHPDEILSTVLLMTLFDASRNSRAADSLLNIINPAARPSNLTEGFNYLMQRLVTDETLAPVQSVPYLDFRDRLKTFAPDSFAVSIMAFSKAGAYRADSVVPVLRRLHRKHKSTLGIADFSLDADTTAWKRTMRPDSASWVQGWTPGSFASATADKLGISALPYFVVCDSAGTQVYRGGHIGVAEAVATSLIKK